MATHKLLLLPGDGIGTEVMKEVERIIAWLNKNGSAKFETEHGLVGGAAFDEMAALFRQLGLELALTASRLAEIGQVGPLARCIAMGLFAFGQPALGGGGRLDQRRQAAIELACLCLRCGQRLAGAVDLLISAIQGLARGFVARCCRTLEIARLRKCGIGALYRAFRGCEFARQHGLAITLAEANGRGSRRAGDNREPVPAPQRAGTADQALAL